MNRPFRARKNCFQVTPLAGASMSGLFDDPVRLNMERLSVSRIVTRTSACPLACQVPSTSGPCGTDQESTRPHVGRSHPVDERRSPRRTLLPGTVPRSTVGDNQAFAWRTLTLRNLAGFLLPWGGIEPP